MNLKRHSIGLPLCMAVALLLTPKLLFAETISESSSAQVSVSGSSETGVKNETRKVDEPVKHKAQSSIKRGERLLVRAKLNTKDGVQLARVYFKSDKGSQYSFVVLNESKRSIYEAELPAVGNDIEAVEYKIVFKDGMGEVYKTDKYSVAVAVAAGAASTAALSGFVDVFSEYPEDKSENMGFSDVVRYSYSAGELVTQSGYVASVSSPGAGYVGATGSATGGVATSAAGSSAAASSGTVASSATVATTAASGGSAAAATGIGLLPIAAVTGGAAAVVAVVADDDDSSSSSDDGDCFSGIVKYTTTESEVSVSQWVEFRSGVPYRFSVENSVTGCQDDVTGVNVQFSAEDKAAYQENCITQEQIEEVYSESDLGANSSYEFVTSHVCATKFEY